MMERSPPSRQILPLPRGMGSRTRDLALHAHEHLVLKVHDGVVVVDGREHEAQGVLRAGGVDDLQAGDVGQPGLEALGVLRRGARARARGQADDHGHGNLAAEHIAHLGGLVDELVHADGEEVAEHQLGYGPQARGRRADGAAYYRALGDGRIAHALGAELVEHAHGHAEAAAELADVLAEE